MLTYIDPRTACGSGGVPRVVLFDAVTSTLDIAHPLARDDSNLFCQIPDRRKRGRLDLILEPGRKTYRPQHAQFVFAEALLGIADRPHQPMLQIGEAAESVGLSLRTVRYWEELGLVQPEARSCASRSMAPSATTMIEKFLPWLWRRSIPSVISSTVSSSHSGSMSAASRDCGFAKSHDAVRIVGLAELPLVLMHLVDDDVERMALGRRAKETILSQMGATSRTLDALQDLVVLHDASRATTLRAAHKD